MDEAQNQFRSSDAARDEAAAKIESAKAGVRESEAKLAKAKADVNAAVARLQVAKADYQRMQAVLQYAKITAPYDGVVTQRNVHTGHFIPGAGSREPLFVVMRTDRVRVFVDVPEKDATSVKNGDRATIRVQALGGQAFDGKVSRSSWALDPRARTLRAEVEVSDPESKLRPGMYANASIIIED